VHTYKQKPLSLVRLFFIGRDSGFLRSWWVIMALAGLFSAQDKQVRKMGVFGGFVSVKNSKKFFHIALYPIYTLFMIFFMVFWLL
jgi:hypothetical protein